MNTKKVISICAILSCLFTFASCNSPDDQGQQTKESRRIRIAEEDLEESRFDIVSENSSLILYFNPATAEISVKDKRSGNIWYSNPQDRINDEGISNAIRSELGSQLEFHYITTSNQNKFMNNGSFSIDLNQFEYKLIENGVKVTFEIGKEVRIPVIPQIVGKERFENEILESIADESEKKFFKRQYAFLSSENLLDDEKELYMDKFPIITEKDVYILRPNLQKVTTDEVETILQSTGYTSDDLAKDHEDNGYVQEDSSNEIFNASIEYRIEDDGLVVVVPADEIVVPDKFKLVTIKVMEFFGAQGTGEEGYIFVPDGSGALINLNNGKTTETYSQKVYGDDDALEQTEKINYPEQIYLPVYGMKASDKAFLAVIEKGDAVAHIKADVSGRTANCNTVYSSFNILEKAEVMMGSRENKINMYQENYYSEDIQIRYGFLSGDDADYSGMAKHYRDYLIRGGAEEIVDGKEAAPLYVDLIGAIDDTNPILGIPIRKTIPLTTYKEAEFIVDSLLSENITNINVKYSGWLQGGVNQGLAGRAGLENSLGTKRMFLKMRDYFNDNSIGFYPDVDFQYAYKNGTFDKFIPLRDAARLITKSTAMAYRYDPAAFYPKSSYWVISPGRFSEILDKFFSSYSRLSIDSISLRSIGSKLNGDYNKKKNINREQAKSQVIEQLEKLSGAGISIITSGGNAYTLAYVDHILDIPYTSSKFRITDESVPFIQMVYRGLTEYAGTPVNFGSNTRENFLRCIETGSGLYFRWIFEDNHIVKDTNDFTYLFSVNYKQWLDEAVSMYKELNSIYSGSYGQSIVSHSILQKNVTETVYENGLSVIVNHGDEPVEINGSNIEPYGYKVSGKGN